MIGSLTITQTKPTLIAKASIFQTGPPGPDGPAGPNSVTSATTSDGTADLSVATLNIADGGTLLGPNIDNPAATVVVSRVDGEYARLTVGGLITLDDQTATVSAGFGAFTSRVDAGTIAFTAFEAGAGATFTYGTGSASAHRTALGLGTGDSPTFAGVALPDSGAVASGVNSRIRFGIGSSAGVGVGFASPIPNVAMGVRSWGNGVAALNLSGFNTLGQTAPLLDLWGNSAFVGAQSNVSLGIGTTTPTERLDVVGNIKASDTISAYGTYTDTSNYRRLALKMSTTGVAQIVAEGGGSGAAGNVLELPANTTFADSSATRTALGGGATGQAIFQAATTSAAQTAAGFVTLTPAAYANLVATGTADADTIYIVQE
jgi:hypothetical protein